MKNILIFGGTFNPIHSGHKQIIVHLASLGFDEVLLIPTYISPHKAAKQIASFEHRYNMCYLVSEEIDGVSVSKIEFLRKGKSYTIDTVKELKKQYGDCNLTVACGGDMIASLDTWHRFDELKDLCSFLYIERKGLNSKALENKILQLINLNVKLNKCAIDVDNVSSTLIRNNLELGLPVDSLLPKKVYDYIKENGLYKE